MSQCDEPGLKTGDTLLPQAPRTAPVAFTSLKVLKHDEPLRLVSVHPAR